MFYLDAPKVSTTSEPAITEGFFISGFDHPLFSALYIFLIILACIITTCIISITTIVSVACFCIIKQRSNKEVTFDTFASRPPTAITISSCPQNRADTTHKLTYVRSPSPVHSCSSGGSHNNQLNSSMKPMCINHELYNMDIPTAPSQNSYNHLQSDRGYHTHSSSDAENNYSFTQKNNMHQTYTSCSRCSSMAHSETKLNSPILTSKLSSKKSSFNQNDDNHLHQLRQTCSQYSTLSTDTSNVNIGDV